MIAKLERNRCFCWFVSSLLVVVASLHDLGNAALADEREAEVHLDLAGDPLPKGAVARFGTLRYLCGDRRNSIAISPDGKSLATVGEWTEANSVKLWDVESGKALKSWSVRVPRDTVAVYSNSGEWLLLTSASRGRGPTSSHLSLIKLAGNEPPTTKKLDGAFLATMGHEDEFLCALRKSPEVAEVIALDMAGNFRPVCRLEGDVDHATISANGERIVTQSSRGVVSLWRMKDGKLLCTLPLPRRPQRDPLLISGNGERFAAFDSEQRYQFWNEKGEPSERIGDQRSSSGVSRILLSPNESLIALVSSPGIEIWNRKIAKVTLRVGEYVDCAAFSPDSTTLYYVEGGVIQACDLASGKSKHGASRNSGAVQAIAFSPKGTLVLTAGSRGPAFAWTTKTALPAATIPIRGGVPLVLPNETSYWERRDARPTATPLIQPAAHAMQALPWPTDVACFAATPKQRFLYEVHGGVRRFEIEGVSPLSPPLEFGATGVAAALHARADGAMVAAGYSNGGVSLFDVEKRTKIGYVDTAAIPKKDGTPTGSAAVTFLHFSPDGRELHYLTNAVFGRIQIQTEGPLAETSPKLEARYVATSSRVAATRDGAYIILARADLQFAVWDTYSREIAATGRLGDVAKLTEVDSIALSPDMSSLATGHRNGLSYLWSLAPPSTTGEPRQGEISKEKWQELWRDFLAGDDKSYAAAWNLARHRELTTSLIEDALTQSLPRQLSPELKTRAALRAIHMLERIDTPSSRKILTKIGESSADPSVADAARLGLLRSLEQ